MIDAYAIESAHASGLYTKQPLTFVRGQGATLWDDQGQAYIDCMAGHGVANLGHAHPKVAQAIAEQAQRLITLPETYCNDQRAQLGGVALQPGARAGARLLLQLRHRGGGGGAQVRPPVHRAQRDRGRHARLPRAHHGGALRHLEQDLPGALRAVGAGFQPVPYNKIEALEQAVDEGTAAVILEAVQGEGGVHVAEPRIPAGRPADLRPDAAPC